MAPVAEVDTVLTATAAGLLVWAGAGKLLSGRPPAGLPAWSARPFAALEVAAGAAWLTVGGPLPAAAVAALYACFSVVVGVRLARGDSAGCGCLGGDDERPDGVHLTIDAILAAAALGAALRPPPPLLSQLRDHPGAAPALVLLIAAAVACTALVLAHLSRSVASYRPLRERA